MPYLDSGTAAQTRKVPDWGIRSTAAGGVRMQLVWCSCTASLIDWTKTKAAPLHDRALRRVIRVQGSGKKNSVGVSTLHMHARIGTTCRTFGPNRDEYVPEPAEQSCTL